MWSRDDIRALVGGAPVFARDERARLVALPAWLAPRYEAPPWDEQVSSIHVADRPGVVKAWWDAVERPGVPVVVRFRSRRDDTAWHLVEARYLNLLDDPTVGAVLIVHDDRGPTAAPDEPVPEEAKASFEAPTWIIQHLDPVGTVLRTEGLVEEVFGRAADAIAGRNVLDVLHPEDHDAAIAMWLEVVAAPGATRTIRQRVVRPDGTEVWLESTVMNQLETTGAVVAVSHDVSARHHQDAALRASEREFRALAEGVPAAVFRATADGTVTYANTRCAELLAPAGEVRSIPALDPSGALGAAWEELAAGGATSLDVDVACPDGRTLRVRGRGVPSGEGTW